jgi:hypothetical protein
MVVNAIDRLAPSGWHTNCFRQRGRHRALNLHTVLIDMKFLRQVWLGWKEIASFIGDFQARWLLTVFYFTLAVPFGLIARLAIDPLLIYHTPTGSAWIMRQARQDIGLEDAKKQF